MHACRPPCGHLVYLHVGHHVQLHVFLSAAILATLSTSMSATMSTSMSATMSATMSAPISATTMSSQRFVRSQRRWQNGNPKLLRTKGPTVGLARVGARDTCVSEKMTKKKHPNIGGHNLFWLIWKRHRCFLLFFSVRTWCLDICDLQPAAI